MKHARRTLTLWYGLLVVLIVALGTWWTIVMSREGRNYERLQLQGLETERLHAAYLMETVPGIADAPERRLQQTHPDLRIERTDAGVSITIAPGRIAEIEHEARRRQRMFVSEGIFFMLLLAAGVTILTVAQRRERDYKRARELFLAGATHEFKTPLASLRLYTETLDRPELPAERARVIRARLVEDVDRLESLVGQVLALSQDETDPAPREVLDLARQTDAVLRQLRAYLREHAAEVETEVADGHMVHASRLTLDLALLNLVRNAVQHGGDPARIRIHLSRDGKWHRLAVSDRGPGIPRRFQKKVFDCFHSGDGDGSRPGAGIGLYLVKRIIERLGGRVELESREGEGSTFTLVLPAHEGGEA